MSAADLTEIQSSVLHQLAQGPTDTLGLASRLRLGPRGPQAVANALHGLRNRELVDFTLGIGHHITTTGRRLVTEDAWGR